jgi:hypothetical protein
MQSIRKEVTLDTSTAVGLYERPALLWDSDPAQRSPIVWWVVFVGFAYTLALAYAWYCRITGGDADISLTWKGFKVECKSS